MSGTTNPLLNPGQAAHEVIIEMIKAGKISYIKDAEEVFTRMFDHYRAEQKRIQAENTSR